MQVDIQDVRESIQKSQEKKNEVPVVGRNEQEGEVNRLKSGEKTAGASGKYKMQGKVKEVNRTPVK